MHRGRQNGSQSWSAEWIGDLRGQAGERRFAEQIASGRPNALHAGSRLPRVSLERDDAERAQGAAEVDLTIVVDASPEQRAADR